MVGQGEMDTSGERCKRKRRKRRQVVKRKKMEWSVDETGQAAAFVCLL